MKWRALSLGLALVGSGCSCGTEDEARPRPAGVLSGSGPSAPSANDRIPPFVGEPIGAQPGHLEGAVAYGSVTLGPVRAMLEAQLGVGELAALGHASEARLSFSLRPLVAPSGETLGAHLRVDLPLDELDELRPALEARVAAFADPASTPSCERLPSVIACGGRGDDAVVVRERGGGVTLDWVRLAPGPREARLWDAALDRTLELTHHTPDAVAKLGGDLGLALDGPGLAALLDPLEGKDRREARAELRGRADARLFAGVLVEAKLGAEDLEARVRWRPKSGAAAKLEAIFELDEVDADVPSIAALCAGALACARSRGVPNFGRFAGLAQGIYADPSSLARALGRDPDLAALTLALETWPNAIATVGQIPARAGSGAEAYVTGDLFGILARVLGFGVSIRSLEPSGRGARGEWLAYARLSAADLASASTYLELAELRFEPRAIPGVEATIRQAPLPPSGITGTFYGLSEPAASTGAWGWAVLADDDARVEWFADLAHDDGAAPMVYAELRDLGQLVDAIPGLTSMLGPARSWLAGRWLRAQIERAPRAVGTPVELRLISGRQG